MSYERLWERLLDFLNGWCKASEVEPGRIEITIQDARGRAQLVEIVMTRDEWDGVVGISWGDFDAAAQELRRLLLTRSFHERYLICRDYQLIPSEAPTLATGPRRARRDKPQEVPSDFGQWVTGCDRDSPNERASR